MIILRVLLLWPFGMIFAAIVTVRNFLFDREIFKAKKFPVKVISVGNLSMGGTGKTPMTANIVENLVKSFNKKVCVVSRGYRGTYTAPSEKVDLLKSDAATFYGDEPTWFARRLNIPVFVGRNRAAAVAHALRDIEDLEVVVADDGFQHRWLQRDIDIVLIDVTGKNSFPIPVGRFREPMSSLKRAQFVIVSKSNLVPPEDKQDWLDKIAKQGFTVEKGNLFFLNYIIGEPYPLKNPQQRSIWNDIRGTTALASSIARPDIFKNMVEMRSPIREQYVFSDHYIWTQKDLEKIKEDMRKKNLKFLLITEKDEVKIRHLDHNDMNIYVAPLAVELTPKPETFYAKLAE